MGIRLDEAGVEVNRIIGNREATGEPLSRIWFNRVYQALTKAREFPEGFATTTINTVAGTATIAKPADYFRIITLKDNDNDNVLVQISGKRYDTFDTADQGQPQYYSTENATNLELWRVPDAIYEMFLRYRKTFDELTLAAHTTELGTEWDQPLVFMAAALGFTDNNEFERAQAMEREAAVLVRRLHDPLAEELLSRDEPASVIGLYGAN